MKKRLMILILGIVILGGLVKAVPDFTINSEHPRIFINPDNIDELRNRAATIHSDTYADLKQWCDDNWDEPATRKSLRGGDMKYDAGVLRYALIYQLGEIEGFDYSTHSISDYGDMTVTILLDMVSDDLGSWKYLVPMATAYDWTNDKLTNAQKSTLVGFFVSKCGSDPGPGSYKGYHFPSTPPSLYPGLAFYGDGIDDTQAQKYIDYIPIWLDDVRCVSHMAGEDGGHAAGLAYTKYGYGTGLHLGSDLYALVTATSLTIDDTFNKYPYMNGLPTWFLYGIQPGPPSLSYYHTGDVAAVTKIDDCGSWIWNIKSTDYTLIQALRLMASVAKQNSELPKAQWITWLINDRLECPSHLSTFDILFNDRTISALSPEQAGVSPVKAFGWDENEGVIDSYLDNPKAGLGQIYMKSSWDQGKDTTHALFKAPPYYYFGHQHFDSLSFSIFKGEPLALPNSGAYYMHYEGSEIDLGTGVGFPHQWHYYERTVGHNSLLILDPDEVISNPLHSQMIKDGGQRMLSDRTYLWGDNVEDSLHDFGGLIRHEDTDEYTYSSADATKAYNSVVDGVSYLSPGASPKTSLVQREFVYLKSDSDGSNDYFVVFDRVDSADPSFTKVFLLHTVGEPVLDGDESQVYGGASGGLWESDNTDSFVMTQTAAKLFMKTLLPSSTKVYKMGGEESATTTQIIDIDAGTAVGGPKLNISISSTAGFSEKPVVTIEGLRGGTVESREGFMCEGKTSTQLINCIRGERYWRNNPALTHKIGNIVRQEYAWMIRQADDDAWISYPYDLGGAHTLNDFVNDCDEYGRWALRIETTTDENLHNFLHVLHPTVDMGETQMAETTLIDAGNMKGTLIKDSVDPRIVMFSPDTSQVGSVTYDADYLSSQTGRHLITGLVPNVNYKIYKNGVEIDSQISSDQGTVYFESTGGSTFSLSTAALEDCESIGGTCKDYSCSSYTDCTSLSGICSAGYCCQGSCEAASSCESGADEDNSGDVSMDEVVAFIEGWKTGSITIAQVLDAIGEWKSGC